MSKASRLEKGLLKNLQYDLPSGLVVFLVALPLCLGIALASGADAFSGLLAGIIGGLVVPLISRSALSVSGPAAGLTAIVLTAITKLGFEAFLAAVFIGGAIQLLLGFIKAGTLAYFFPSSVIKGMLTAIGLILILKQLPHAIGYDAELFGLQDFFTPKGDKNTFSLLGEAFMSIESGALIISLVSLAILLLWENTPLKRFNFLPGALVVVIVGTVLNMVFRSSFPEIALAESHLVRLPLINHPLEFLDQLKHPDFSAIAGSAVLLAGLTIGLVASMETLLSVEAVDQLDPFKRESDLNREMLAQGTGNMLCGLLGALPITAVIVRSSANVNSGGRTRMASIYHGIFLLLSVLFIGRYLNLIPLSALAAILLMVGYKLAKPSLFRKMYKNGWSHFIPFIVTVLAILLTDMLIGIGIGMATGIFFVIRTNFRSAVEVFTQDGKYIIKLRKDVSFLNKAKLVEILRQLPEKSEVVIDATNSEFVDDDIAEILDNFKEKARQKGSVLTVKDLHTQPPYLKKEENAEIVSEFTGRE